MTWPFSAMNSTIASMVSSAYPIFFSARGIVWFTICIEPPPTSFLNLTSEKSGSMPVVSQSIMKPMVPVGASTEACALRKPFFSPSFCTSAQAFVASLCTPESCTPSVRITSFAAWCLRITRLCASALRA